MSSEGGVTAFPGIGAYHASKWALEGLSQSLSREVADFGIDVTLVEPGPYGTDWLRVGAVWSEGNPAYAGAWESFGRSWEGGNVGDPKATRDAILKVVDAEEPPLRVFFGETAIDEVSRDYESRLATWREWQPVSVEAHGVS